MGGRRSDENEDAGLFRDEAVQAYSRGSSDEGTLIRISPRWVRYVYAFIIGAVTVTILFGIFFTQREYASGPAIVRLSGQTELTSRTSGTVESVDIIPGSKVESQQVLVTLHADAERDMLDKLEAEFDIELIRLLRNPEDTGVRSALAQIRADIGLANARLQERVVRAPHDGFVHDIRIRPGRLLTAGDPILSIVKHDRSYELVAFLPGQYRPLLEPGQELRLEIAGYSHAYESILITHVGDEVIGPSEARRFLGPEVGDAVPITGPVILVRAVLESKTFTSSGRNHLYFSGMQGLAEVPVREEPLIVALIPGLRAVLEKIRE
jgi:hypothetical protein